VWLWRLSQSVGVGNEVAASCSNACRRTAGSKLSSCWSSVMAGENSRWVRACQREKAVAEMFSIQNAVSAEVCRRMAHLCTDATKPCTGTPKPCLDLRKPYKESPKPYTVSSKPCTDSMKPHTVLTKPSPEISRFPQKTTKTRLPAHWEGRTANQSGRSGLRPATGPPTEPRDNC